MTDGLNPIPLAFWRSAAGQEPVREWLRSLSRAEKHVIGRDIAKVQFGWPVGLPLCRALGGGLWEVRSSLPNKTEARIMFGFHEGMLIALHAFIKKGRKASKDDLSLATKRLKELKRWRGKTRT
jgi:phage-related protein